MITAISTTGLKGGSQGALASAFINEINSQGYCPTGFELPSGKQPELSAMGLKEHEENELFTCVQINLDSSDGFIYFYMESLIDPIDKEIMQLMEFTTKPYLFIDIEYPEDVRIVERFIQDNKIDILHIDGSQDSKNDKTVYKFVYNYMNKVIKNLKHEELFQH
jgi:hypothetical protein